MKYNLVRMLFLLLCYTSSVYAQKQSNTQVDLWIDKSRSMINTPDSLFFYAKKAYDLAQKNNYAKGKANGAKMIGVGYFITSNSNESLKYYKLSLGFFEKLNDTLEIGKAYLNLATTYNSKQQYKETITNALLALKKFKLVKDVGGEGRVYNLLAIVYANQDKHKEALEYLIEYKNLSVAAQDVTEIANSYNNIGHNYMKLKLTDSALRNLLIAEKMNIEIGSFKTLGAVYHNLGELYVGKGEFNKAIFYYKKALENHVKSANRRLEGSAYLELGKIYQQKNNDLVAAEKFLSNSLMVAKELDDHELLYYSYWNLGEVQNKLDKVKLSNANLILAAKYKDSLNLSQNSETVKQLQVKYETERLDQKISMLNQQNTIHLLKIDQRNLLLIIFGILIILVSLLSYFIYYKRKEKEKQMILQADLVAHELKRDAETKLSSEKLRIARDLHDNIGSYLTFIKGSMDTDDLNPDKMVELRDLTSETIRELRKTVWLINKEEITIEEFSVKLREFYKHIKTISIFSAGLVDRTFLAQQATDLFRVIQEAVNNAIKHSGASQIDISIKSNDQNVVVNITDNGVGFNNEMEYAGYGIENMRTRAAQLKGELSIKTKPEQGTTIELTLGLDS